MKFEQKHPQAGTTERFEFEYSYVTKDVRLGPCSVCGAFTRWIDGRLQKLVCSEECCGAFWKTQESNPEKLFRHEKFDLFRQSAETELALASLARPAWKDIIIVVRDQLSYLKMCIESVRQHTRDYTLYIWDNGSGKETAEYLEQLQAEHALGNYQDWDIEVWTSKENEGFIKPNNRLAAIGDGEYIILLNSDTKVYEHWDTAMLSWLQNNSDVGQVGYWGGHLGPDGRGFGGDNGYDVDYIPGWCFAIQRSTYEELGLFNEQDLKFAYCEDADFSLRVKESGRKLYAIHAPLVYHFQNKTIQAVKDEGKIDVAKSFQENHTYLCSRWANYLANQRVLIKKA